MNTLDTLDTLDTIQPSEFGRLLKRYRLAAELTQQALAERAGLSAHGISDLERGVNRTPQADTLSLLAEALGLSDDERAALEATVAHKRRRRPRGGPIPAPAAAPSRLPATSSLPVPLTPLIGRDGDIVSAAALLREGTRLLTLVGPGGVGKTRLALGIAAGLRDTFPDGVLFVSLAAIASPDLVLPTLMQAVGLRDGDGDGRPPRDTLISHLSSARALLVLDNFEHLIAAAPLVAELLASCPDLRILATSRTLLRVRGERAYTVSPLTLPDREGAVDLERLVRCAAIQLFVERAREVSPGLALTDVTAPLIARVCARLDGLPLAIELAAARLKILTPLALSERVETGLSVLAGGARDLPPRQRALRDTLAWSYELLDAPSRDLFPRLAVFAGGCTLEAVEALSGAVDDDADATAGSEDALDSLTTLVDNSLLRREESADEVRFTMLETVREYALERLRSQGEVDARRRRHAAYVVALVEAAAPDRAGVDQAASLARLDRERGNVRAALEWTLESEDLETGLRLAGLLRWFWLARGYLSEGRYWLGRLLAAADAAGLADDAIAPALTYAAVLAASAGSYDEAAALFERNLDIRQRVGDGPGSAVALNNLGLVAMHRRDYAQADALYARALALCRDMNDTRAIAHVLGNLGELARLQGDSGRATTWATESLDLYTKLEDTLGIAQALHTLGGAALLRDDTFQAATTYGEALELSWRLGNVVETANNLEGLAVVAVEQEDPHHAALLFGAAATVRETNGASVPRADRVIYERAVAATRVRLDADSYAEAWTAGRELPLAQVVDRARRLSRPTETDRRRQNKGGQTSRRIVSVTSSQVG